MIIRLLCSDALIYEIYFESIFVFFFFQSLTLAMKAVCEILTTDLEGGPARIPFSLFKELYTYLAEIDGEIPKEHVSTVIDHLNYDM